jgi:hypothetical protein
VGEFEKYQIPTKEFLKFSPAGSTPFFAADGGAAAAA